MKIGTKNAIILCNGEPPMREQITIALENADLFIAADGGGNTARMLGLIPHLVIGDLDSYQKSYEENIELVMRPDQNSNDLEKALQFALDEDVDSVLVFGATGYRVDQTVKNLSVLKQFHAKFDQILFRDKFSDIKLIDSPFRELLPVHTSISLFPLSGVVSGITSKGLKYQLKDDTLENGVFDGSSNLTVKPLVEITYRKGDLLLFINHNIN